MKNKFHSAIIISALALTSFASAKSDSYHLLREIPITGEGGWDYLSIDAAARRLYVTHASKIVVIDLDHDAVVGEIGGLSGVHGFAVSSKLGYGFATNGKDNTVSTIDLATFKTVRKSPAGENPDAVLFEPTRSEVYAFNGRSHSVTVIAASSGDVIATLPLTGKPEFSQTDGTTVFANIEDTNQVIAINLANRTEGKPWSITPGEEPTGLELDRDHQRLFIGCSNEQLVVLNSRSGEPVANVRAGKGIDAVGFDPATQLIFTSNGADGTVTIIHEDTSDKYSVVQTLVTERGARTLAVDPQSHRIYLTSAKFETAALGTGKRPALIPGTVKVLVYGPTP